MDYRVEKGSVAARIQLFGAMVSPEFVLEGRLVQPFYQAPWDDFPSDPLLAHLRGDFACVPFGIGPSSMDGYPPPWDELESAQSAHAHGYPANNVWEPVTVAPDWAELLLELPEPEPVESIRRTIRCVQPWVFIEDEFTVRRDVSLPLGLHPMFRLPSEVGGARLRLPGCQTLATLPVPTDARSVLLPATEFEGAARAPLRDGGVLDLTSLPLPMATEELVLLVEVAEPRVALENLVEGYRIVLEWESDHLSHCLLWISNRGRAFPPWDGRNLCLGVEPVTSAFDLGTQISTAANPLAARGIRTAVALESGKTHVLRHRFKLEALS